MLGWDCSQGKSWDLASVGLRAERVQSWDPKKMGGLRSIGAGAGIAFEFRTGAAENDGWDYSWGKSWELACVGLRPPKSSELGHKDGVGLVGVGLGSSIDVGVGVTVGCRVGIPRRCRTEILSRCWDGVTDGFRAGASGDDGWDS